MRKTWFLALSLALLLCLCPMVSLALESIEITSVRDNGDGTVTIAWDNPNGGDVTVGSLVMAENETGNRILAEQNVSGSTYTFTDLAPGIEYALLVFPELELEYADFELMTVPEPPAYDGFRISVKDTNLTYFVRKGNDYSYSYAHDLSNEKIYDLIDEKQFWVRMNFNVSPRGQNVAVPTLVVITAPNGYVVTDYSEMEIKKDWVSYWRTMVYMNGAFEDLYECCGEIPAGKYNVKLYLDGGFADESSFTIKE